MSQNFIEIPHGKKNFSHKITIPGSKSETNRAVHIACLARGISRVENALVAEDTKVLQNAWRDLGAEILHDGKDLVIKGTDGCLFSKVDALEVGESGTTARFLVGALGLAKAHGEEVSLYGHPRMGERPFGDLLTALEDIRGINFRHPSSENNFRHPSSKLVQTIKTRHPSESLIAKTVYIPGHISSQFISSLLMALPTTGLPFALQVTGELVSKPYIEMTLNMMESFGVKISEPEPHLYVVPSHAFFCGTNYRVMPDASSASYFLALAAIHGAKITIEGLQKNTQQGDIEFVGVLERMGCDVIWHDTGVTLQGKELRGVTVDMAHFSDVAPTLAVVALFAKGRTEIRNVQHMRLKECDRISSCVTELKKLGAWVSEFEDGMSIEGGACLTPTDIETYQDHRMAMAFSLVGSLVPGVRIKNPACVSKTFPEFFSKFFDVLG